jgi:hypothetical protein
MIPMQMVGAGVCEWASSERNRAFIWWKSPDQWASDLHKFALRTGEAEVVETINYFQSEAGSPVLGMSDEVILRICQTVHDVYQFFCCPCHFMSASVLLTFVFQLASQNRVLVMASESGHAVLLPLFISAAELPCKLQTMTSQKLVCRGHGNTILRAVNLANVLGLGMFALEKCVLQGSASCKPAERLRRDTTWINYMGTHE